MKLNKTTLALCLLLPCYSIAYAQIFDTKPQDQDFTVSTITPTNASLNSLVLSDNNDSAFIRTRSDLKDDGFFKRRDRDDDDDYDDDFDDNDDYYDNDGDDDDNDYDDKDDYDDDDDDD